MKMLSTSESMNFWLPRIKLHSRTQPAIISLASISLLASTSPFQRMQSGIGKQYCAKVSWPKHPPLTPTPFAQTGEGRQKKEKNYKLHQAHTKKLAGLSYLAPSPSKSMKYKNMTLNSQPVVSNQSTNPQELKYKVQCLDKIDIPNPYKHPHPLGGSGRTK